MGVATNIPWCHHTWNPWRGCWKISEGCANCYAERDSHRNPRVLGHWGKGSPRVIAAEAYWRHPYRWEREARDAGERRRVFSLSLGDWLELHEDLGELRARLLATVERTPGLDWLLLTKRPEDFRPALSRALETSYLRCADYGRARKMTERWLQGTPPKNVWAGVSAENHRWLIERSEHLREIPAAVRFISAEPLIGDLLAPTLRGPDLGHALGGIDWMILGGESGAEDKVRPCDVHWIRRAVHECRRFGVAPFVKQLGARPVVNEPGMHLSYKDRGGYPWHLKDPKGGDPDEWPEDLRVREFPAIAGRGA